MPAPSCVVCDICVVGVSPSSPVCSQVGYMPCQRCTIGGIQISLGLSFSVAVFFCSPLSCHFRSHLAVIVPSLRPCMYMRQSSSALHFASMRVISHPPKPLGRCSVVGTLNTARFHVYHVIAAVIRRVYVRGAGDIWTIDQNFDSKLVLA